MHVLNLGIFPDDKRLEEYLTFVKYLLNNGFRICEPDYHGHTIPDMFLKASRGLKSSRLSEILSLDGRFIWFFGQF